MEKRENLNIQVEYGKENLKEILIELLREQYINHISRDEK